VSGRDYQLPVGDRDFEDTRADRATRREDEADAPPVAPPKKGEGLGTWLKRQQEGK
jgi:hypothetical protein